MSAGGHACPSGCVEEKCAEFGKPAGLLAALQVGAQGEGRPPIPFCVYGATAPREGAPSFLLQGGWVVLVPSFGKRELEALPGAGWWGAARLGVSSAQRHACPRPHPCTTERFSRGVRSPGASGPGSGDRAAHEIKQTPRCVRSVRSSAHRTTAEPVRAKPRIFPGRRLQEPHELMCIQGLRRPLPPRGKGSRRQREGQRALCPQRDSEPWLCSPSRGADTHGARGGSFTSDRMWREPSL